jgi:hypothetical protein
LIEDSDGQQLQRPVAIVGLGGAGKSTVASLLVAEPDVLSRYPEGTLWASLGPAPAERILDFQRAWASALGYGQFAFTTPDAAAVELRSAVAGRRVLLVVDDVWASDDLAAFSVGGPGSRLLITTRDYRLAEQIGARIFEIPLMPADLAVELLEHRLGRPITQGERPMAERLIARLGYLPLALDLAAGQVGEGVGWDELLADLTTDIARLETLEDAFNDDTGDDQARSRGLLASLRRSVARLPAEGQSAFAWLGILQPDAVITPGIASTVWAVPVRDAARTLRSLWARGLLLGAEGSGGPEERAFKLHSLTGDFARYVLAERNPDSSSDDLVRKDTTLAACHRELLVRYHRELKDQQWSSVNDDGYIIEHLTWHMEKGDREDWIHELLWQQDVERRNAWYHVRERDGGGGFGSDVARAWRLSERVIGDSETTIPGTSGNPSVYVVRYMSMSASLASLSANLPPWLAGQLVRHGLWGAAAALAAARLQKGTQDLYSALAGIAAYLDENLSEVALTLAREEPVGGQRTTALMSLGLRLPRAPRADVLLEAIAASSDAGGVDDQAGFLAELREFMSPDVGVEVKDAIVARAAEILPEITDPMIFAQLVAAIVKDLEAEDQEQAVKETLRVVRLILNAMNAGRISGSEGEMASVVRSISPYLAARTRRRIVDATRQAVDRVHQPSSRASALLDLAHAATGQHRAAFVSDTKKCIREAATEELGSVLIGEFWLEVLIKLLELCPQEERTALVNEAWTKVRTMSEWWRFRSELAIAPHLTESSASEASADLLYLLRSQPDLLEDLGTFGDDTKWLEKILDSLPEEECRAVLRDARVATQRIGDDPDRGQAVLKLAQNLPVGATREEVIRNVSAAIVDSAESWEADDRLGVAEALCDLGVLHDAALILGMNHGADLRWLNSDRFAACVRATLPILEPEDKDRLLNDLLGAGIKQVGWTSKVEGLDLVVAEASDSLFYEAIQEVHHIESQATRAASLPSLLPRLVGNERVAALAEAKIAIEQLEPNSERAFALGELLACVDDSEYEELWIMVQALPSAVNRAEAVEAVADRLSEQRRSEIVKLFEHEFIKADPASLPLGPFEGLAKYIDCEKLPSFLEKIHAAPQGFRRLKAMTTVVRVMDSSARTEAAAETLDTLREEMIADRAGFSLPNDYGRGSLVARITPYLPEVSVEPAMEFAQALSDLRERTLAVRGVADKLELLGSIRVDVWLRAMRRSGERSRGIALADLGALSSLMEKIGGSELLLESIHTVENVVRWWP